MGDLGDVDGTGYSVAYVPAIAGSTRSARPINPDFGFRQALSDPTQHVIEYGATDTINHGQFHELELPMTIAACNPQMNSPVLSTPEDTTERNDRLQLEMWVLGERGKSIGTIDELRRDPVTGHVSGIIVRREIVSQRRLIPVSLVTAVTPRSVQIQMSRATFKLLPRLTDE